MNGASTIDSAPPTGGADPRQQHPLTIHRQLTDDAIGMAESHRP
jgi:hypothetical protein